MLFVETLLLREQHPIQFHDGDLTFSNGDREKFEISLEKMNSNTLDLLFVGNEGQSLRTVFWNSCFPSFEPSYNCWGGFLGWW